MTLCYVVHNRPVTGCGEHCNGQAHYIKLWICMSSGAAVDFAQKADQWRLLFLMILVTVMQITYKTGAV